MSRVGSFRWRASTDAWIWSPALFEILGYRPDAFTPTRSLIVAHVHPADRPGAEEVMAAAVQHLDAFTSAHRVLTVVGAVREVLVVGYALRRDPDPDGRPNTVLHGWVVDRTAARDDPEPSGVSREAARTLAHLMDTDVAATAALIAHLAEATAAEGTTAEAVADRVVTSHLDPDRPGLAGLLRAIDPRSEP